MTKPFLVTKSLLYIAKLFLVKTLFALDKSFASREVLVRLSQAGLMHNRLILIPLKMAP